MLQLTKTEIKVLLTLFKDFSTNYNANILAKKIGISRAGALKILKQFKAQEIVVSKRFGRAVFYKLDLEEAYAKKVIETLLMAEARHYAGRWLFEFEKVFSITEIVIIFGSAIRNYEKANDIDVVLVFTPENLSKVKEFIKQKNQILPKRIHPVIQSPSDIEKNLNARDEALISAVKFGYVLQGYQKIIEVVKNVTRF